GSLPSGLSLGVEDRAERHLRAGRSVVRPRGSRQVVRGKRQNYHGQAWPLWEVWREEEARATEGSATLFPDSLQVAKEGDLPEFSWARWK
ncbi:MAG: hypothetical protein ACE5I0_05650, partial [Candidatus Binatia bacterium]